MENIVCRETGEKNGRLQEIFVYATAGQRAWNLHGYGRDSCADLAGWRKQTSLQYAGVLSPG